MAPQSHLFWRPGAPKPAALPTLDREPHREGPSVIFNQHENLSLAQQRRRLPIYDDRRALLHLVETYATVVVVGHTGCGKTTQLPQYLHEAGWTAGSRMVACTQPRRVAATSVAARVAEEMGCELGGTVGYAVRFDEKCDADATRLKYMTDGMLIRELLSDPLLTRYSVVMVDEAHERSCQTDVLLGLLKKLRRHRPELRLVIASATVDADAFADFFECGIGVGGEPVPKSTAILSLRGSGVHPVAWHFLEEPTSDYLEYAVEAVRRIHAREPAGDVLLFLTGQQEVDTAVSLLADFEAERAQNQKGGGGGGGSGGLKLLALPMYSGLTQAAQLRVFQPAPRATRKVIVATNIAETSITIDGVVHVVDCGFVKERRANPLSGEEALVVAPVSQASARQRAGRAGRVCPGKYYCMMSEDGFHALAAQSTPEVQRCALDAVVLRLKALGVDNVLRFDYPSPPPPSLLSHALEALYALGALDGQGQLTQPHGERMAMLPLEPQPAAFLLMSAEEACEAEALTIAALLSVQSPFLPMRPADLLLCRASFAVYEGDALTALNMFRKYSRKARKGARAATGWCRKHRLNERVLQRVGQVRAQLSRHTRGFGMAERSCEDELGRGGTTGTDAVRRALVRGFFANAARHEGGGHYTSVLRGAPLRLHHNSVLFKAPPDWIVYHELTYSKYELIVSATKVDEAWLAELAPHFYTRELQPDAARLAPRLAMADVRGNTPGAKRPADEAQEQGGSFAELLGASFAKQQRL